MAVAARTVPAPAAEHARTAPAAARVLLFLAVTAIYAAVGARMAIGLGVLAPDAMARLARAYLVWHGEPARLATLGLGTPPLPSLALLPLAVIGPLATSLVALPLYGGLCGAVTVLALDSTLARCGLTAGRRAVLVLLVAVNPVVAFQFTAGTQAALALALLALAMRGLVGWAASGGPGALLGAGAAFAGLVLCRYELAIWAAIAGAVVAVALTGRGAEREEAEGSVTAFGAPATAAVAVVTLLSAAILDAPARWISDAWEAGSGGGPSLGDALWNALALGGLVLPVLVVALCGLVLAASRRRDAVAAGLGLLLVAALGAAALHAYAADATGPLRLATGALLLVVALTGAAWASSTHPLVLPLTAALLAAGVVTSWLALEHYPYAAGERAWARALRTGEDQQATAAADVVGDAIRHAGPGRVLADPDTTGAVILRSRRAGAFVTSGAAAYVLAARGDRLDRSHPGLSERRAPGLEVIAAAGPYVLARVLQ